MASKTSSKTKKKRSTSKKKVNESQRYVRDEVLILLSLAISVLILISNFGLGGFVGEKVSTVIFGVFGMMGYAIPFLLFLGVAFGVSNRGNSTIYIRVFAGLLFICMMCSLFELIVNSYQAGTPLKSYYTTASVSRSAGGFIGGVFVRMMCPALGIVGSYVVVIIVAIICLIIVTERAILHGMKQRSEKAYQSAKEDAKKRKEQSGVKREKRMQERQEREQEKAQRREEARQEKLRRANKQVAGVSFDTTLTKKSPEVKELSTPEAEEPKTLKESTNTPKEDPLVINRAMPLATEDVPEIPEEPMQAIIPEPEHNTSKKAAVGAAVAAAGMSEMIEQQKSKPQKAYKFPPISLLTKGKKSGGDSDRLLRETALKLQDTLKNFGVNVTVTNVSCGPSVTRYELQPEQGVKVSKIVGLADDIKLNLAAADIRIEAPIPGKAAVGIEVPNKENTTVMLRDLLETKEFKEHPSNIAFAAGRDLAGQVVLADIKKMPHVLIAGATGSGKSVCINTLIISILYKSSPEDVKLIMIDPKVVELSVYNGIPHLMIPVVTDPKKAAGALNWAVVEMTKRYQLFAEYGVRDLKGYNDKIATIEDIEEEGKPERLPQIIIIVDELADLMMVAPGEVEEAICRLAQLARAAGIHLVLATQRPSVNVITGLIKANMPSRIAFSVSSGVDSRTIIDMNGAEKLLGKGDMLFYPSGYQKPARVQGSFVSDKEVQKVVDYLVEKNGNANYNEEIEQQVSSGAAASSSGSGEKASDRDVYFVDAGKFIIEKEKASIGMLQRVFKIGFNRAARIMDQLAEAGVVGEEEGTKPRKVLMSLEEFEQYIEEYV